MATINYCRGTSYPTNVTPANEYGLCFYDSSKQRPFYLASDGVWKDANGYTQGLLKGESSKRPTLTSNDAGYMYFDTQLGCPIWWNGTVWVDATGVIAGTSTSGTFANKPTVSANSISIGFKYFCTDKQTTEGATNGIEIIHKGSDVWVDALGRVVS